MTDALLVSMTARSNRDLLSHQTNEVPEWRANPQPLND